MEELRKFASRHNLSRIIRFHNDVRASMKAALAKADTNSSLETISANARWQDYDKLLRTNTFLMLYAHTEEWLHLLSKKYFPAISIKGTGSITRYKAVVRDGFKIDVSDGDGAWILLTDCERFRNCLLHANGRLDLMKDDADIKNAARKRGLDTERNRLEISSEFLASFANAVGAFIDRLR